LCENAAIPGREEYLDSEKYQFKERDWDAPGNIKDFLTRLNKIRRDNRALHFYDNLRFYHADNGTILFYGKMTPARDNIILVVVNVDPFHRQHSFIDVPVDQFGEMTSDTYEVDDLLNDERYVWHGRRNYIELDPLGTPAHIFRVRRLEWCAACIARLADYRSGCLRMKKLFWLLLVPASATLLFAQSPAPVVPDLPRAQTVLDAMFKAGPIMIPLFLLSVVSVMLVIVYFMTIRRGAIVSRGFMATADALLRKRD